ncbi:MAG: helix-turn-helix transcriptional regulator [Clostridia bacterium]|nr:helix-turn-helix transcriptional regulator [Clostridia bacterium]
MKELNIAGTLAARRREKGITQDALAAYIGVSKASVSKWETGQSYPDITFLPQLAAFFNITVDELIGYAPQLSREDIRALYRRLAAEFGDRPFEEVLEKCRETVKKYAACFPVLFQMAVLLVNHHMLADSPERRAEILEEAASLCGRIRADSGDVWLSRQSASMEALCRLMQSRPVDALDLLDGAMRPFSDDSILLASAWRMAGDACKAREALQSGAFQHLLGLASGLAQMLAETTDEPERFEETVKRLLGLADLFDLDRLHPNTAVQACFAAANGYAMLGQEERAIDLLQRYVKICLEDFYPLGLHGDGFFDSLGGLFGEMDLGTDAVRDEKLVRAGMVQSVEANPGFAGLAGNPRFKSLLDTLKSGLGGY